MRSLKYNDIPKDELEQLSVQVHPEFRREIAVRAAESGQSRAEVVHDILVAALGDPDKLQPPARRRRPLATTQAS